MIKNSKLVTVLTSAILAVIMAAAIVVGILGGVQGWGVFNGSANISDSKTVTVSVSQYLYKTESDALKAECDKAFDGLDVLYITEGEMSGDESEIVYVFSAKADVTSSVSSLENAFVELTKEGAKWNGYNIKVTENQVNTQSVLAKDYVLRGCIAGAVIAVLAFAYVALRHQWMRGAIAGGCALLAMLTTTAIILVARVFVTPAIAYAIAASALLTLIAVLFNFNKLSAQSEAEAEDAVASSIAVKEIVLTTVLLGLAVIVAGILGSTQYAWLAVSAVIAIIVAAFFGLVYAPVLCVPVQKALAQRGALRSNYQGAQKTSMKLKKLFTKKEKAEEKPVEETQTKEVEETETAEVEPETEEVEEVEEVEAVEEETETENNQD